MRLILSNDHFAVFDDVLTQLEFRQVWQYVQDQDYRYASSGKWEKVFGLLDGRSLEGPVVLAGKICEAADKHENLFPTGTAIDLLFTKLLNYGDQIEAWTGRTGHDWHLLTGRAFLYPCGTALSWHDDGGKKTASFTYYSHLNWNIEWGGELMIATHGNNPPPAETSPLNNDLENELLMESGFGHYVMPKPNRLVVISAGTAHRISRVDIAAGHNTRCSISGFFVNIAQ